MVIKKGGKVLGLVVGSMVLMSASSSLAQGVAVSGSVCKNKDKLITAYNELSEAISSDNEQVITQKSELIVALGEGNPACDKLVFSSQEVELTPDLTAAFEDALDESQSNELASAFEDEMTNSDRYELASLSVLSKIAPSAGEVDDDVVSIAEKQRPLTRPLGVRAGAFEIRPEISISQVHDDNIFSTKDNEESDSITLISPKINIQSMWSRHMLALNASANVARYSQSSNENYEDSLLNLYGRYDIVRDTFIDGNILFERKHEDRGSPDEAGGIHPTEYSVLTGTTGFVRDLGKVSLGINGELAKFDFNNVLSTGGMIDLSGRDRNQYKVNARLGYEFHPNYEGFVSATYDMRRYDVLKTLDRDSDGYDIVAGTDVDLSGKVKGSVYVGYIERSYDDLALRGINGIKFGGDLIWNKSGLTSVLAGFDRSIGETTLANSSGFIATESYVSVEHELLDNLVLDGRVSFINNDYEGGTGLQRNDDILGAGIGAKYLMSRNLHLSADYDYSDRDSNITNSDYTDNRGMLRFSFLY